MQRRMPPLALFYKASAYSLKGKVMGRQAAGAGFIQAIAQAKPERLWCFAATRGDAVDCAQTLTQLGSTGTGVTWIPLLKPAQLTEPGLLFRPDAGVHGEAWRRHEASNPRSFSICGITHTTATHAAMEAIAGLLTAPCEDWDALICTSRAVRDSVRSILENTADHLRERMGATRFTLPQMPLIPLGIHCDELAATEQERAAARESFGIAPDETVILFVGRLSFHAKAHPLPMYLASEACARDGKITLLQAGWFANESIERVFREEAHSVAPSVRHLFADARDPATKRRAFAAADFFVSLADSIQETFGLTPVEAMAAGLPAVVSDWNGYRDTVRDGIDGIRVPTVSLPAGLGRRLAERYDLGIDSYDAYCNHASQHVAVDVSAASQAFRKLILDPSLRRQLGEQGRRRARADFDWSAIMRRYADLWEELRERRRAGPLPFPSPRQRRRPDRPDPFEVFATYPSVVVGPKMAFRLVAGATVALALSRRDLKSIKTAEPFLPATGLIEQILTGWVDQERRTFEELAAEHPHADPNTIASALVWLTKAGILSLPLRGS